MQITSLLAGVNDAVEHAIELAELLHEWGPGYHVNLIPFNPIEGSEFQRPYNKAVWTTIYGFFSFFWLLFSNKKFVLLVESILFWEILFWQVQAFAAALESRKVTVSVRQTRGLDASAACGQLRNEFQKSPLQSDSNNLQSQLDVPIACWCHKVLDLLTFSKPAE